MNRIYQGRITAVQMAKPIVREELNGFLKATKKKTQGNWQNLEKEKWENLLWQHHELFQDAVNYYTLALGALGEGLPDSHPLQKLRARMQEAWDVFPKRTVTPAISLGNSLRKHLGLKATATFDDACRKIVPPDIVEKELAAQVADFLSVDLTKTSDLSEYGRSAAPRYINPDYKGNFRDEFARKTLEALELRLAVHDLVPRNLADFGALSLATASQRENRNDKTGEDARKALIGFVKKLAMAGMLSEPKAKELTNQLKQLKAEKIHQIPAYEAGGDSKEKSLGIPALLIGKQLGFDLAIKRCLTASIPKPAENWQNGLNQARETVKKGADPLLTARGNQGYVFLAFTALPTWKEGGETKPTWIEFDIAAFKEALVTINQFNEKTKEREERKTAVSAELEFMLGGNTNWSPKTQSEEDEREVPVLAGDPRYEKLLDILEQMDDERAVQDKTKIVGPTQAALRGFGKLRSTWIDLHREKLGQPGETLLQQAVTNLQREHKLDMGHTDLFLRLCTQENWTVWLEDEDQNVEIEGSTKRARNVVCAAAVAQELADELERLQEAIRYTPAEPQFSRRLYMFSDIKNKESVSHIGYGNVDVYVAAHNEQGKLAPCRLRLNYAAPRMVRDQLADGAASKWLQPMMAALGLQPEEQPQFARDSKGRTKPPAVELMPDWVGRKRFLHFLLNFPVDIDTEKLTQRIGKSSRWAKQMNAAWEKNKIKQRFHVMWDNMEVKDTQKPNQWWWDNPEIQRDGFTCLAIDLGQRRAADFALLHTAASELKDWFVRIGEAGGKSWYTRIWKHENPARPNEKVSGIGSLRLPGEDAKVFYKGKAGRELSGKKGRLADADDYEEAIELAEKLLHSDEKAKAWLGDSCSENSFPEQNDKLVRLFLGALSRYRTWHRWSWQLQPKHSDCWERIFKKEIAKIPYFREWGKLAEAEVIATNAAALQAKVAKEANELRQRLEQAVERLANRVVPLRDNTWRWIAFGTDPRGKPLHQLAADGEKQEERPWLRGQRGLSLNRIEQLEIFRRGILSLNRLMRHQSGVKP
ncbi:MAG: type V CRISPR-associated protein Cas12b, partial [Verrucomicrobiales bacterium]|nr:type V CRISPR-associated protein Cas12b [Verrucomicrobiales bacterium]